MRFINKDSAVYFHGSNKKFNEFKISKYGSAESMGTYMTDDFNLASDYASMRSKVGDEKMVYAIGLKKSGFIGSKEELTLSFEERAVILKNLIIYQQKNYDGFSDTLDYQLGREFELNLSEVEVENLAIEIVENIDSGNESRPDFFGIEGVKFSDADFFGEIGPLEDVATILSNMNILGYEGNHARLFESDEKTSDYELVILDPNNVEINDVYDLNEINELYIDR